MNEIQALCAFLARHRPTRERPRLDVVAGWTVRLAEDERDLSWSFSILADRWNGPYATCEAAVEAAERAISDQRTRELADDRMSSVGPTGRAQESWL